MNEDIKSYAKEKNVNLWRIASELGINDGNFSRKLRHELPEDTKKQIFKIIDALAGVNSDYDEENYYQKSDAEILMMYFNKMSERQQKMLLSYAEQIFMGASADVLKDIL